MKMRALQLVQLLGILPVTIAALIGVFFGLAALATSFTSGHFWGTLLLALAMIAPGVMVLCLWVAILYPPGHLVAREQAAAVAFGMVLGCALALWFLWDGFTAPRLDWRGIAMYGIPLVLAVFHIAAISKASRAPEHGALAEPPR